MEMVEDIPMTIMESIISNFTPESSLNIVYISKHNNNLDTVGQQLKDKCFIDLMQNTIYLVHPIGIKSIVATLDVVYYDVGSTNAIHLMNHLKCKPYVKIVLVDANTQEVIDIQGEDNGTLSIGSPKEEDVRTSETGEATPEHGE